MFYIKIICWSDLEIWLLCTKADSVSTERLLPGAVLLIKQYCWKENIRHFVQSVHRLLIVWSWCSQQIQSRRSVFIHHESHHYLNTPQHHYISHIFPRLCSLMCWWCDGPGGAAGAGAGGVDGSGLVPHAMVLLLLVLLMLVVLMVLVLHELRWQQPAVYWRHHWFMTEQK